MPKPSLAEFAKSIKVRGGECAICSLPEAKELNDFLRAGGRNVVALKWLYSLGHKHITSGSMSSHKANHV